jgi:dTDP-glucose 4,6-dehydratase
MRVLITGGCGFVGHHFVEHILKRRPDWEIVVIDKLGHSGDMARLRDIKAVSQCEASKIQVFHHDLRNEIQHNMSKEIGAIDLVFHIAAESHVDRSIKDPLLFVESNVVATTQLMQWLRTWHPGIPFFYFSTDEVFGPAPLGTIHSEFDAHNPGNPYAASKSGGEQMVRAFANTYKMKCVVTRSMNIFGERQHPEKFIPHVVRSVIAGQKVMIHADRSKQVPGSRFWIHARNVADAYLTLVDNLDEAIDVGTFHIVGEREINNLELAQMIAACLDRELIYELVDFHSSRPGHDLRYAMIDVNLSSLGWKVPVGTEEALKKTVQWTVDNPKWLSLIG